MAEKGAEYYRYVSERAREQVLYEHCCSRLHDGQTPPAETLGGLFHVHLATPIRDFSPLDIRPLRFAHAIHNLSSRVSRKLPSAEARGTRRPFSKFSMRPTTISTGHHLDPPCSPPSFPFGPPRRLRLFPYRHGASCTVSPYKFTSGSRTSAPVIRGTPGTL